jgi:hypothetical protein
VREWNLALVLQVFRHSPCSAPVLTGGGAVERARDSKAARIPYGDHVCIKYVDVTISIESMWPIMWGWSLISLHAVPVHCTVQYLHNRINFSITAPTNGIICDANFVKFRGPRLYINYPLHQPVKGEKTERDNAIDMCKCNCKGICSVEMSGYVSKTMAEQIWREDPYA